MAYGDSELIWTPCPACGCADVFTAVTPLGQREMPLYPACVRCGRERDDLADFYADPPTQPQRFAGFSWYCYSFDKAARVALIKGDE